MPNERRTPPAMAQANGITLCHDSFGAPTAPPLLLIMGLGGQMIAWDDMFCTQLAGLGYRDAANFRAGVQARPISTTSPFVGVASSW